jgi:hypothetical protein
MLTTETIHGHPAVILDNGQLRVTVLPEKGADIYRLVHLPADVDALMKTPWGLNPPGERPPTDFLENYEGGWQELFPSANDACTYRGVSIPFHGEAALQAWNWNPLEGPETGAVFRVTSPATGLMLERVMRLPAGTSSLVLEERVTNPASTEADFVWGHHVVLGAPFLEAGCQVDIPATTILTPEVHYEPGSARLAEGQRSPWPWAEGRTPGSRVDLRRVPGPDARGHDDIYLLGLQRGELRVANPRLRLRFTLAWDPSVFRCIVFWQPLGGADLPPLTGIYGLGVEPWVSRFNLAQAIEHGEALHLEPGASLYTRVVAALEGM